MAVEAPESLTDRTLGYWFRFNPERRALHFCRWSQTDRGSLVIRAACEGVVIDPTAEAVPPLLAIPATADAALATIQPEQRRMLCRSCAARMGVR